MRDPFKIEGPALISFSGGRTSGYMLWRILQAHGGTLPDDVRAVFANTGREMPGTLDFVHRVSEHWAVPVTWLEYPRGIVSYHTASRNGEPYSALNEKKRWLPNPRARTCTIGLKLEPLEAFATSLGWDDYLNVVGLRADEPSRVSRMRGTYAVPLAQWGTMKADVLAFWKANDFDLQIKPGQGNCDLCFLKGAATILGVMRDVPGVADWWIEEERKRGSTFRFDRPSYAEMAKAVREQRNFDFGDRDELIDCFCGDGA